jgi:hypothetical protein
MDELRRTDCVGVHELGLQMMKSARMPEPACLKEVLDGRESESAVRMMHLSMRPMEHRHALLGMAWAFVGLHESLATSGPDTALLSVESKRTLGVMAQRERVGLQTCLETIREDAAQLGDFEAGFRLASGFILGCFV